MMLTSEDTKASNMPAVEQVVDFICSSLINEEEEPSVLKAHKLLYYVQAWHLALHDIPVFEGQFEAWVHGPVNPPTFYRFKSQGKSMFSSISEADIDISEAWKLSEQIRLHITQVLESYGEMTGTQLEELTHSEAPWIDARKGLEPYERSNHVISEDSMRSFYSKLAVES